MSRRTCNLFIREDRDSHHLSVFSDLGQEQIQDIDGVMLAEQCKGYIYIEVDPRYDVESIKDDIRMLASQAREILPRLFGAVGEWTSVEVALPKGGINVIAKQEMPSGSPRYYAAKYKFCSTGPNGAKYEFVDTSFRVLNDVTHWTPIP